MSDPQAIQALNDKFAIPGKLRIEAGESGLACAVIKTEQCLGRVYLYGAHVAAYQPVGHDPLLFVSPSSLFTEGKAIRGGVPICFPWFGPNMQDPSKPQHGYARTKLWALTDTAETDAGLALRLETDIAPFHVCHDIVFGKHMTMTLRARNTSQSQADFEAAQHTYFTVSDIKDIHIAGLEHTDYFDKTDDGKRKTQDSDPIRFTSETDRLYIDTEKTCVLTDPGLGRMISVKKTGSNSTVVWNPWIDKAKAMCDFGDNDWPGMVCIETANAGAEPCNPRRRRRARDEHHDRSELFID